MIVFIFSVFLFCSVPFCHWNVDNIVEWLHRLGLSMYTSECKRWMCNGEILIKASSNDLEKVIFCALTKTDPMRKIETLVNLHCIIMIIFIEIPFVKKKKSGKHVSIA